MKQYSITLKQDGCEFIIKERTSDGSTMYRVLASNEDEARKLFELNSHLVKFIGSVNWR